MALVLFLRFVLHGWSSYNLIPPSLTPTTTTSHTCTHKMAATMLLYPTPISHPRSRRNTAFFRSADAASLPWLNQDQQQDAPPVPPPKSVKRSPSLLALRVIPYTTTEWKKLLVEIKREYMAKHYRACASRCAEILDNIKHSVSVT